MWMFNVLNQNRYHLSININHDRIPNRYFEFLIQGDDLFKTISGLNMYFWAEHVLFSYLKWFNYYGSKKPAFISQVNALNE